MSNTDPATTTQNISPQRFLHQMLTGYWIPQSLYVAAKLGLPDLLDSGPSALEHLASTRHAGGVVLGVHETQMSWARAVDRLGGRGAYSVEVAEDAAAGLELLVGARRDPRFGPIVVVGAGGTYTELFRDTAVALAPVDEPRRPRCCSARWAARRSSQELADVHGSTWAPLPRGGWRRCRGSRLRIRRSPRSR